MDPNANLQEQERIIHSNAVIGPHGRRDRRVTARLRELREALSTWIDGGGFEPDWTKAPLARRYFLHTERG